MRPLSYWVGTALLSLGVVILLIAGGIYAYGLYEDGGDTGYDDAVATETALALVAPSPPTTTPTPTVSPSATPEPTGTPTIGPSPVPMTPTLTPTITPTATPTTYPDNPSPATSIRIASIKLNAPVKESAVKDGQWVVPKFAAGHLQGTADPGGSGNAVFAGHVSSIASGNVFANIGKVNVGDEIVVVTNDGELRYQVSEKKVVKNDDLSVTKDFGDQRITLITCTGTWMPLVRDFNQRLIVFALRVA